MPDYQICTRCVMDTSVKEIKFNPDGTCSYCTKYFANLASTCKFGEAGDAALANLTYSVRQAREKTAAIYDCVIGLSGGADSTMTAYVVKKKMGLKPLAVTLDNGWNTPESNHNVKELVRILGIPLITHAIDFDEMKSLELAYLRASVLNLEATSDHAIVALLWHTAAVNHIPYILTGHNYQTEYILPLSWRYQSTDLTNILGIHRCQGNDVPLKTFPQLSAWKLAYYQDIKGIKVDYPLNYLLGGYNKAATKALIGRELNWHDYGGKHYESIITRFYQGYILPTKWGIDKRRCHLATLVCSEQMTRDEALAELAKPPYDPALLAHDREIVCQKLGLKDSELDYLLHLPNKKHTDYQTDSRAVRQIQRLRRWRQKLHV